jgi:hypothetical protein
LLSQNPAGAPERILRAVNRPSRANAEALIGEQAVPAEVPEAPAAYNIRPVVWSLREQVREWLVA